MKHTRFKSCYWWNYYVIIRLKLAELLGLDMLWYWSVAFKLHCKTSHSRCDGPQSSCITLLVWYFEIVNYVIVCLRPSKKKLLVDRQRPSGKFLNLLFWV
jgi:hypothetical protein